MISEDSLKSLTDQYYRGIASDEMNHDVREKTLSFTKDSIAAIKEQMVKVQEKAERTLKDLQTLNEMADELIGRVYAQTIAVEERQHGEQEVADKIDKTQIALRAAQNDVLQDLEKMNSIAQEFSKFCDKFAFPDISTATDKLGSYHKHLHEQLSESLARLALIDGNHLDKLEKMIQDLKLETSNMEKKNDAVDAENVAYRENIAHLTKQLNDHEQQRNVITQHKELVEQLKEAHNERQKDKEFFLKLLNAKRETVNKMSESKREGSSRVATLLKEKDTKEKFLHELENKLKHEQTEHERKLQEIAEEGRSDLSAAQSLLATIHEKTLNKKAEVQQTCDDCKRKSDLQKKIEFNTKWMQDLVDMQTEHMKLVEEFEKTKQCCSEQILLKRTMEEKYGRMHMEYLKKHANFLEEIKWREANLQETKDLINEHLNQLATWKSSTVTSPCKSLSAVLSGQKKPSEVADEIIQQDTLPKQSPMVGQNMNIHNIKQQFLDFKPKEVKAKGNEAGSTETQKICDCKTEMSQLSPQKFATNEVMSPNPVTPRTVKNPFMQYCSARGGAKEGSQGSTQKCVPVEKLVAIPRTPLNDAIRSSRSERQTTTAREMLHSEEDDTMRINDYELFGSDISSGTITPLYTSTPIQTKKRGTFQSNAAKNQSKKRGRPRGKKKACKTSIGTENTKFTMGKDTYDLDSDD